MPIAKRKRVVAEDSDNSSDSSSLQHADFDISLALIGKRSKIADAEEDNDDLADFIQTSIAKRSIKEGTQAVKNAKGKSKITKGEIGGGSFQSMGLHPSILRSLTLQGYRIPTPIQRLSIPALLANPPKDLVGMARTGSGKSLAFLVPLVQRLGGRHSTVFGARALILLPTRELALQVMKVGKELARGFRSGSEHVGDKDEEGSKKSESLRWGLVVGGEGLDEQFEMMTSNPDVIIATPGRLLHLIVEMDFDLKSVQYAVFDEADRLFEMGFDVALNEILQRLPSSRQTILFSATLPKSLVEFARAGLQEPKLVRLDAESKISSDLKMAFFSIKQAEKEACLLSLLRDIIKVPLGSNRKEDSGSRNRAKGKSKHTEQLTAPHQTLIFAATKHHVEFLLNMLTFSGYSVSHIYGSLDQEARSHQMDQFRRGITNILVVTDVAARGIDIPVLENVVNYDFPQGARVFVHRVGRTARAGRQGWAWSFVTNAELPYLLDLQLFLGRPLVNDVLADSDQAYAESLVFGNFQRDIIDEDVEYVRSLDAIHHSLPTLRDVMKRGHAMYERSKGKASQQSYRRAKEMTKDPKWLLAGSDSGIHPVLLRGLDGQVKRDLEKSRKDLLHVVRAFRPSETVFEVGSKGSSETAALMKERRKALKKSVQRSQASTSVARDDESEDETGPRTKDVEMADEDDIVAVFGASEQRKSFRDDEFYMSYTQKDAMTEKGYSLNDGASSFVKQAQNVTFDLTNDEGKAERRKQLTWDKKKKKFIQGDGAGADNVKMVKTENGTKLPATFRSGRFNEWKSKSRISLPRIGETENASQGSKKPTGAGGHRFKHNKIVPAKPLDKLRKDYERKVFDSKKKADTAVGSQPAALKGQKQAAPRSGARRGSKTYGRIKTEIKTAEQIRKDRKVTEKRRAKNARPSHSSGKKKGRR